jgi:hypothetical protein
MPLIVILAALLVTVGIMAAAAMISTALMVAAIVLAVSIVAGMALACRATNRIAGWHYGQLDAAVSRRLGAWAPLHRPPQLRDVCARCGDEVVSTLHREGVAR